MSVRREGSLMRQAGGIGRLMLIELGSHYAVF